MPTDDDKPNTIDLAAIEARANAATPIDKWRGGVLWHDGAYPVGPYTRSEKTAQADADFIASARRDVPMLIGALRTMMTSFEASSTHAFGAGIAVGVAKERAKNLGLTVPSTKEPYSQLTEEERQYLAGSTMALRGVLGHVLGMLGRDGASVADGRLVADRLDAVRILRRVCETYGDNDWPDDLNLGDVIEKHLERHLDANAEAPAEAASSADFAARTFEVMNKNARASASASANPPAHESSDDDLPESPCTCPQGSTSATCLRHGPF